MFFQSLAFAVVVVQVADVFTHSTSPLNAQAAELWDTDKEEYKRLVHTRHCDIEDVE